MTRIYIYGLFDPQTNDLRYIGQTVNVQKRFSRHCKEKGKNHKCYWIQSLVEREKVPIVEILDCVSQEDADECEKFWISSCLQKGYNLTNYSKGGQGCETIIPHQKNPAVSSFKGVHKKRNKWTAQVEEKGRTIHLGNWTTKEDAARAYDSYILHFYGRQAGIYLNFTNSIPYSLKEILQESLSDKKSKTSSPYVGVFYRKERGIYQANIMIRGKRYQLGHFKTAEEANDAVLKKEQRLDEILWQIFHKKGVKNYSEE